MLGVYEFQPKFDAQFTFVSFFCTCILIEHYVSVCFTVCKFIQNFECVLNVLKRDTPMS